MDTLTNNGSSWVNIIKRYNLPDTRRSIWQIVNSLVPYVLLWAAMYYAMEISYWITLLLSVFAAGFLVRIFIIFHDCGHGSFFRSAKTCRIIGTLLGSLVFTPYDRWHMDHAIHHSTVGNLDKRGVGDVWTLTSDEYRRSSRAQRLYYRLYRHPVMLFGIGPVILFVLFYRFNKKGRSRKERWNTYLGNSMILAIAGGAIWLMGWKAYVLIQLPVIYFAAAAGTWLFYVQHQFEKVVWTDSKSWDYKEMALKGSSFLKIPKVLQWFSGNIGFHHIHHLGPKIPNYKLEKCHRENPMFSTVEPVTLVKGILTFKYKLWDEQIGRLITFSQFRQILQT